MLDVKRANNLPLYVTDLIKVNKTQRTIPKKSLLHLNLIKMTSSWMFIHCHIKILIVLEGGECIFFM